MLYSKILVAYDGSDLAKKALEKAIEIAQGDRSIVVEAVHVVTIPSLSHTVLANLEAVEKAIYEEGEEIIAQAELALSKIPNSSKVYLLDGSPAYRILNHAKEHNCDLIVMGNRGLTGFKEFMGSVSHTVVQHSRASVLVVK